MSEGQTGGGSRRTTTRLLDGEFPKVRSQGHDDGQPGTYAASASVALTTMHCSMPREATA